MKFAHVVATVLEEPRSRKRTTSRNSSSPLLGQLASRRTFLGCKPGDTTTASAPHQSSVRSSSLLHRQKRLVRSGLINATEKPSLTK